MSLIGQEETVTEWESSPSGERIVRVLLCSFSLTLKYLL